MPPIPTTTAIHFDNSPAPNSLGFALAHGRLTATARLSDSHNHVALRFEACVKATDGHWRRTGFAEASHVFINTVRSEENRSRVATWHLQGKHRGHLFPPWGEEMDTQRARAVLAILGAACETDAHSDDGVEILPATSCRICGRTLTDPESIERGIGPECFGAATESHHQIKKQQVAEAATAPPRSDVPPEPQIVIEPSGNGKVLLTSPFSFKDEIKAITGRRWHAEERRWSIPTGGIPELVERATECGIAVEGAESYLDADRKSREAKSRTDLPDFPGATEGWLHQRQAFGFAKPRDATMLAMGMGAGKSKVAIGLCESWAARRVLVVAPKKATRVWPAQFAQHAERQWIIANGEVRGRSGKILRNPSIMQRLEHFDERLQLAESFGSPTAIVVNYEILASSTAVSWMLRHKWDVLILDESHRIKAPGGKWSRTAQRIAQTATRRLALTGTPMPHSPPDLYAQFRALDPAVFGTSFARYRNQYFAMGGFEGREIVGWRDKQGHTERFASAAFICESEDVLDLPKTQDLPHAWVELGSETRRVYSALHEDFVVEIEEGTVTAANALVQLLREQQVTSGHLPIENGTVQQLGTEKADVLADVLADLSTDEPVVVFARFTHDLDEIERVAREAGRSYGEISGRRVDGLGPDGKMAEGITICGVQIQAGGEGIDLTRARYAVYYSMGFSLGQYEQSRARIHRPGQARPTAYIHLIAAGTIDETIYTALKAKEQVVDAIIEQAKGMK